MHIGVIRGDLPGPILLAGLEPVSQFNPPTEPRGQEVYISRPTTAEIDAVLADGTVGAGATLAGGDISGGYPLVINAGNDDLEITLTSGGAFVLASLVQTSYGNLTDLIAAVNAALDGAGIAATCRENIAGNGLSIESDIRGVDSYIENDTIAGGSTSNTALGLVDGSVRDMPSAADFITASLPVGGPLDVSTATLNGVGAGTNANALTLIPVARGTQAAVADALAPQVGDTPVAIDSFITGDISQLLNANFNPDPRRVPPLANGAAVEVVQADGSTPFAAAVPVIVSATLDSPGAGDVTIAGTDMAAQGTPNAERDETVVQFIGVGAPPGGDLVIPQELIVSNGGSVSATAIVIPAALNPYGFAITTTSAQVKYRSHASNAIALI